MWQRVALASAFAAVGFLAGVAAAPRLRSPPPPPHASAPAPPAVADPPAMARRDRPTIATARAVPVFTSAPALEPAAPPPQLIAVDALPRDVREAAGRFLAEGEVKRLTVEPRQEKGQPYYKVAFERDGSKRELFFDDHGKLVVSETQVAFNEIPPRVQQALAEALPGSGLLKGKRLEGTRYPVPLYEVDVRSGGARREVQVNDAGDIVNIKVK